MAATLPPGWSEAVDPSTGAVYFYDSATNSTSWTRPKAAASADTQRDTVAVLELETNALVHKPPPRARSWCLWFVLAVLGLLVIALGAALGVQRSRVPPAGTSSVLSVLPACSSAPGGPHPCLLRLSWVVTEGFLPSAAGGMNGSYASATLLVNGGLGPAVVVFEGDSIELQLTNAAPNEAGITIHWHGLDQRGSVRSDGVSRVSTAALPPGSSAVVSMVAHPAGTHMWHGHAGLSASQGLHGLLLVRPLPDTPAPPGAEVTLAFSDVWDGLSVEELRARLLRRGTGFVWTGNPDALVVNGVRLPTVFNTSIPALLPPEQIASLPPNATSVRLFLLNACSLSFLWLSFLLPNAPAATLTVVESSGQAVQPFVVSQAEGVHLNAGERLTLLLANLPRLQLGADGQPLVLYVTAATRHRASPTGGPGPSGALAIRLERAQPHPLVQLAPPPASSIAASASFAPFWNDTAPTTAFYGRLVGRSVPLPPPADPSRGVIVLYTQQERVGGFMRWVADNVSFAYPDDPVLQAVAAERATPPPPPSGAVTTANSEVPADAEVQQHEELLVDLAAWAARGNASAARQVASWTGLNASKPSGGVSWTHPGVQQPSLGTLVMQLPLGTVVDVVLLNGPSLNGVYEQHPWHKHGGQFWVLAEGQGALSGVPTSPPAVDAARPPRLTDMVTLAPQGWAWLRFVADNPGVWPFHCHIAWHLQMGMFSLFAVAPELIPLP